MLVFSTRKLTTALVALAMAFGFATTAISQARITEPLATEQLLARSREGVREETYIVSFGLFGPESVFASEAEKAAKILRARLQPDAQVLVRLPEDHRSVPVAETSDRGGSQMAVQGRGVAGLLG